MTWLRAGERAAIVVGAAAALVCGVGLMQAIRPVLLLDADPAWAIPRLLLGLAVIAGTATSGGVVGAAAFLWSRTRVATVAPSALPWNRPAVLLLASAAVVAGVAVRFLWLDRVPLSLWIEDLTLIDPALALRGRLADFADAIRPAPFGVARPFGSVGVLYLEAFRLSLRAFGANVFGVRFLSALAGALSLGTVALLGRALLPRGGGALALLALAGLRWHLVLSRWGYVAIVLLPIVDAATLLLLLAKRRRSPALAAAAGLALGLGAHVYLSAWAALAGLGAFALWPTPGRARTRLAALFLAGFLVGAAPLFLLREGRSAPYFARATSQSVVREIRMSRSLWPVMAAAANAVVAPWLLADPSPWQDVPKSRLGAVVGLLVALSFGRALMAPREELSALLLAQAGAALAAYVASGNVMQPNGYRFGYLTTLTAVAAAAAVLALIAAVPRGAGRPAALALVGCLVISGAVGVVDLFSRWAPRLEVLDGYDGHDNLLARTALDWERYGTVAYDPRLARWSVAVELVRRVRRDSAPAQPGRSVGRAFRIAPAGSKPDDGEHTVAHVPDERGVPWAVVFGRKTAGPAG
jgi:hypothetical protein